jgi:hypothetical protein
MVLHSSLLLPVSTNGLGYRRTATVCVVLAINVAARISTSNKLKLHLARKNGGISIPGLAKERPWTNDGKGRSNKWAISCWSCTSPVKQFKETANLSLGDGLRAKGESLIDTGLATILYG